MAETDLQKLDRLESEARDRQGIPKLTMGENDVVQVQYADMAKMLDLYGIKSHFALAGLLNTGINILGKAGLAHMEFVPSLLAELKPRDAVETMLITQMAGTHCALAETSRRMMDASTWTIRESLERSTTRLSRTYLAQMDALKRYRAKAQQVVRVERVTVNEGGQAIVGAVQHGGEGQE